MSLKRPFYVVGISALAVLLVAGMLPLRAVLVLLAACAVGCVTAFCVREGAWIGAIRAVLLSASIALCLFVGMEFLYYRPVTALGTVEREVQMIVEEERATSSDVKQYTVTIESADVLNGQRMRLCMTDLHLPQYVRGDRLRMFVRLSAMEDVSGDASFVRSSKADGIYLYAWQQGTPVLLGKAAPTLGGVFADVREYLVLRLEEALPADAAALTSAVLLGDKTMLSKDTVADFRSSGIAHILVVSGLHISLLSSGLYALLSRLRVSRRIASWIALLCLCAFALLVGLSASVVRATLCTALLLLGNCFHRRPDARNSLGLALTILLFIHPYAAFDIGLLLTFAATWGLIVLYPLLKEWAFARLARAELRFPRLHKLLRAQCDALCLTVCATVPILPITVATYGEIAWISPLTNLLAVWPSMLLLWCGALSLIVSIIWAPLALPGFWLCDVFSALLGGIAGTLRFGSVYIEEPYLYVAIYGAMALCLYGFWKLRGRGLRISLGLTALMLCAAVPLYALTWYGKTELTVLSPHNSMAILVRHGTVRGAVVDGSSKGLTALRNALYDDGVQMLDFVLVVGDASDGEAVYRRIDAEFEVAVWAVTDTAAVEWDVAEDRRLYLGERDTMYGDIGVFAAAAGFVQLQCGDVRILYCPPGGDATYLAAEERQATVLLFSDDLTVAPYAAAGIWFGEEDVPPLGIPVYKAESGVRLLMRGPEDMGCTALPMEADSDKA